MSQMWKTDGMRQFGIVSLMTHSSLSLPLCSLRSWAMSTRGVMFTAWRFTGTWTAWSRLKWPWGSPTTSTRNITCSARRRALAGARWTEGWSWAAGRGPNSTHMISWRWELLGWRCGVGSTVMDMWFQGEPTPPPPTAAVHVGKLQPAVCTLEQLPSGCESKLKSVLSFICH